MPFREELSRVRLMQAQPAFDAGAWDQAEERLSEAAQILKAIIESGEGTTENRAELAKTLQGLAAVHLQQGEWAEALARAEEALRGLQSLMEETSSRDDYAAQIQATRVLIDTARGQLPEKPE